MNTASRGTILIANPSPDVYGSDLQMLESVVAMRKAGFRVIVAIPNDGPLINMLKARGAEVEFVNFPVLRRANQSITAFLLMVVSAVVAVPRLIRYLRRVRPHLAYVNTVTLPWWLLASRLSGTRSVCHLHEAENTDGRLVRRLLILPLRLADGVIVISKSALTAMLDVAPELRSKAHLIYNGVPEPSDDVRPAPGRGRRRITVVGRLSPRKAPHIAMEAVGRLRADGHDVELELAGSAFDGYEWYVAQLEQRAAEPDLAGAVTFSGYCSPIWPVLERADIVAAPSLREPFGNAVVEAQLALRPVVATAALGHLESITDHETGLLVPPEDVPAMAEAISHLLDDRRFADDIAMRARRSALERFSTARYSKEIVDVITATAGLEQPTAPARVAAA